MYQKVQKENYTAVAIYIIIKSVHFIITCVATAVDDMMMAALCSQNMQLLLDLL